MSTRRGCEKVCCRVMCFVRSIRSARSVSSRFNSGCRLSAGADIVLPTSVQIVQVSEQQVRVSSMSPFADLFEGSRLAMVLMSPNQCSSRFMNSDGSTAVLPLLACQRLGKSALLPVCNEG